MIPVIVKVVPCVWIIPDRLCPWGRRGQCVTQWAGDRWYKSQRWWASPSSDHDRLRRSRTRTHMYSCQMPPGVESPENGKTYSWCCDACCYFQVYAVSRIPYSLRRWMWLRSWWFSEGCLGMESWSCTLVSPCHWPRLWEDRPTCPVSAVGKT